MERFLLKFVVSAMFFALCSSAFSQVKLADSGTSKFYPEGNRITYLEISGFPNSAEMREYVNKVVLENPDISRIKIYTNGKTVMYDALQSIEPDMIVDAMNDALAEYKAQLGDFPANDPPSAEKPKSNVTVKPHKAQQNYVVTEEKSATKKADSRLKAVPEVQGSKVTAVDRNDANVKILEQSFPANNNVNSKTK